jgi:hypothetical protein
MPTPPAWFAPKAFFMNNTLAFAPNLDYHIDQRFKSKIRDTGSGECASPHLCVQQCLYIYGEFFACFCYGFIRFPLRTATRAGRAESSRRIAGTKPDSEYLE